MKTNEYCCDNPQCPNYHKDVAPQYVEAFNVATMDEVRVVADKMREKEGLWRSKYLSEWSFEAKYSREFIDKLLNQGEISESRAEEMLREIK